MQPEQADLSQVLTDDDVLRFLSRNPEFFVNNQDILPRLRIPHETGSAVSLIERQVSVLRGKCGTLENSLRDLIGVARENESLHQRLHVLIQEIISARNLNKIVDLTRASLQQNFNADDVHLLLFCTEPKKPAVRKRTSAVSAAKSATKAAPRVRTQKPIEGTQIVPHDDSALELFSELFANAETICGLPSEEQLSSLVGQDHSDVASAALIPLQHERPLGVIILTSRDESRFASGKGVMFLNHLGQLLSRRLATYGTILPVTVA
ncbi:DUF484 family protein [Granulosicoccus antarcticus]|uniref:DUF484 family protein n=1 Tax=Granulosicoccus antarcticus IMCC3135 TaxID=1192854 RepID=A0A2Z2NFX1_9GAMM|nr:DUF484 family protein [Granulosicoccus antarcticus]ASJ70146.1 hypothetical protein IMCC3135_00075 [Granulosicoccus antarcticus IMCC3135]